MRNPDPLLLPSGITLALVLTGCAPAWGVRSDDDDSTDGSADDDAAGTPDPTPDPTPAPPVDYDMDGVPADEDCDDGDPSVGAPEAEICDGLDQDCDGLVDDNLPPLDFYEDADGDGYGNPDTVRIGCGPLGDEVGVGGDCNDADPTIHVGSTLLVNGLDSDCDGLLSWHVTAWITVDDAFEWCWDDAANIMGGGNAWTTGYTWDFWAESGRHVVGIRGWDTGMVITAGLADIRLDDGTTWVTDATWRFDPAPAAPEESRAGWCTPGFDDSGWQLANDIGPIGTSPWGSGPQPWAVSSPARWIWDYYPVNLNTQYLRKEIVLP